MTSSILIFTLTFGLSAIFHPAFPQADSISFNQDSVNNAIPAGYKEKLAQIELQRRNDSVKKAELQDRINALKTTDNLKKEELQKQIDALNAKEANRLAQKKAQIDSLRLTARGYPVIGPLDDTLFLIYTKIGASTPQDRAINISTRIRKLADYYFHILNSITTAESENTYDVIYRDMIIMSISESDANKQASVCSELHRHIQDVCNERGIKILSPHFRAVRDGNTMNVPPTYHPRDYQPDGLRVDIRNKEGR